jgi:uncharacterized protein
VIGNDPDRLKQAITEVIRDIPHTVIISNSSATGKYHCLNVELVVPSEKCRIEIYENLKKHPAIRIVL